MASIVQHVSGFTDNATTLSVSFASAVTAGNMIVALIGTSSTNTLNIPTMTGETFTAWASTLIAGGGGQLQVYAVNSAVGGQVQVTEAVTGASQRIHIHLAEVNGQTASPRDAQGTNSNFTNPTVSTSGATTNAVDIVIAFFYDQNVNATWAAGSGYAALEQTNNPNSNKSAFSEWATTSSTGVQTATATGDSTVSNVVAAIVAVATSGVSLVFEDDRIPGNAVCPNDPIVSVW